MNIPVFHDDQHGTAIISARRAAQRARSGGQEDRGGPHRLLRRRRGGHGLRCGSTSSSGCARRTSSSCDRHGVIYKGRDGGHDRRTRRSSRPTPTARTLADALAGADVFIGLSVGGIVTPGHGPLDGARPDRLRHGQPRSRDRLRGGAWRRGRTPSWPPAAATTRTRSTTSSAFPFIFRGALDVPRHDDQRRDEARRVARAGRAGARKTCPTPCCAPTATSASLRPRVPDPQAVRLPRAAQRAARGGARGRGDAAWRRCRSTTTTPTAAAWRPCLGRRAELMHGIFDRAKRDPKRIVFPEGEQEKILRAAKILIDEGIAHPILLARREEIAARCCRSTTSTSRRSRSSTSTSRDELRALRAALPRDAAPRTASPSPTRKRILNSATTSRMMMVEAGDADGVIAGLRAVLPGDHPAGAADHQARAPA